LRFASGIEQTELIANDEKVSAILYQITIISELGNIGDRIDRVFHFDMNPNNFLGFDTTTQIELNKYIQGILDNG